SPSPPQLSATKWPVPSLVRSVDLAREASARAAQEEEEEFASSTASRPTHKSSWPTEQPPRSATYMSETRFSRRTRPAATPPPEQSPNFTSTWTPISRTYRSSTNTDTAPSSTQHNTTPSGTKPAMRGWTLLTYVLATASTRSTAERSPSSRWPVLPAL